MKLLLCALQDSYNFTIAELAKRATERGLEVAILKQRLGEDHEWMLRDTGAEVLVRGRDPVDVSRYDAAIFESLTDIRLRNELFNANVLTVAMALHVYPPRSIIGAGFSTADVTIVNGTEIIQHQRENGILQEFLPFGAPQYDPLSDRVTGQVNQKKTAAKKSILFLEQHFYPGGDAGKRELAQMLVNAAETHSTWTFTVKPRTLPSSSDQATHWSSHLYDYVLSYPPNLKLLNEHKPLLECISEADVVATTFSTAAFPALLSGKPVVFVKGFTHRDTDTWNAELIETYYDYFEMAGHVIDWKNFSDSLDNPPVMDGTTYHQWFHHDAGNASNRILDFCQNWSEVVSKAGIILPYLEFNEQNWMDLVGGYSKRVGSSKNDINLAMRMSRHYMNSRLDRFFQANTSSGLLLGESFENFKLAAGKSYRQIQEIDPAHAFPRFKSELDATFDQEMRKAITNLKSKGTLSKSFIGWLVLDLFYARRVDELLSLGPEFDGPDRDFVMAMLCKEQNLNREAALYFTKYLNAFEKIDYPTSPALRLHIRDKVLNELDSLSLN